MIREQLFLQFAANGLNQALDEMIKQYKPKKGQRFKVDNITYEIGSPVIDGEGVTFEISSKIPSERLSGNAAALKNYFSSIKKMIRNEKEKPVSIEMENIVRSDEKNMEKSRDYVKLSYKYDFNELYDEKKIAKEIVSLSKDKASLKKVPHLAGATTIGGRLVLLAIKENIYKKCSDNIKYLIKANKMVKN